MFDVNNVHVGGRFGQSNIGSVHGLFDSLVDRLSALLDSVGDRRLGISNSRRGSRRGSTTTNSVYHQDARKNVDYLLFRPYSPLN
jgi:hypothetical protein